MTVRVPVGLITKPGDEGLTVYVEAPVPPKVYVDVVVPLPLLTVVVTVALPEPTIVVVNVGGGCVGETITVVLVEMTVPVFELPTITTFNG